MSSQKSNTPEKLDVPSLPSNLEDLEEYVPPRPTNLDPYYGRTMQREDAGPSILSLNPDDPLPSLLALRPPSRHVPNVTINLFDGEDHPAVPTPPSLPPSSRRPRLCLRPQAEEEEEEEEEEESVLGEKENKNGKPNKTKRTKKMSQPAKEPMYHTRTNNRLNSSPTTSSVSIPSWGVDFPRTGFAPTDSILEHGSLKGHYSKDACRSAPPAGTSEEDWKKKFRSAESVLMKQLKQIHGNKAGKAKLDEMRDEGWVRDRALYMLEKEKGKKKEKKAAKEATAEEKNEDEDVEMAEGEERKEAEEEDQVDDVWGPPEDGHNDGYEGWYYGGIGTEQTQYLLSVSWREDHCLSYVCKDRFLDTLNSTQWSQKRGFGQKKIYYPSEFINCDITSIPDVSPFKSLASKPLRPPLPPVACGSPLSVVHLGVADSPIR